MGVLSALGRITLRDLDKGLINAASRRGIESSVDPRLVLGGGAAAMFPVGAASAAALQEYKPWEAQMQRENQFVQDASRKTDAIRAVLQGLRPEDVEKSDPALASAMRGLAGPPVWRGGKTGAV